MTLSRLPFCLVIAASACIAGAAMAGGADRGLVGGLPVSHPGLPLDPELLPPNTGPGDCVIRRVTGPGGAYRWDRVECDPHSQGGWSGLDPWGYGGPPLAVTQAWGQDHEAWEHEHDGGRVQDRYGPLRRDPVGYRYAGRDADGYLVWPGKRP